MFRFLKLVNPVWYFNLSPSRDHGYFPSPEVIREQFPMLQADFAFSPAAAEMELSYRAHRLGCVDCLDRPGIEWWNGDNIGLVDEYRFVRKYFHYYRVLFVLLLRILTLNNPFREIKAFFNSSGIRRFDYGEANPHSQHYFDYKSELLKSNPEVTVIIPTLNRYEYLKDVLSDLEKQEYGNFDVIVVDQSQPYQPEFYKDFKLNLQVIHQEERALWLARNTAVRQSRSDYLLFYDDDSRIASDWISQHLKCLDYFNADISSGVSISKVGAKVPENYRFFRWSDQLDTGNVLIRRRVFLKTGFFDRQFEGQRMGDGEFGLRAYLAGFRNISNPLAQRLHLKVGGGGLREMGSWDAFRPKSILEPRPVPSVLYFYRKYHGVRASLLAVLLNLPPSIIPYKYKKNKNKLVAGSIIAVIISPFILIQVWRSWIRASRMLKNSTIESQ